MSKTGKNILITGAGGSIGKEIVKRYLDAGANCICLDKSLKIFTTLSGIALLIHPWQWQNLVWEFQTPWFFINVLVLLGIFVLSKPLRKSLSYIDIIIFFHVFFYLFQS